MLRLKGSKTASFGTEDECITQSTPDAGGAADVGDYHLDGLWDTAVSAPGENAGEPRSGGVRFAPSSTEETYSLDKTLTPFGFALPHGTIKYGEVPGL